MRSREYYEKKIKKKITKIFKKQLTKHYKHATKNGKVPVFTYESLLNDCRYVYYPFFKDKPSEWIQDSFINAVEELSNKYEITYIQDENYFTIERISK